MASLPDLVQGDPFRKEGTTGYPELLSAGSTRRRTIQDTRLKSADFDFFEYYLESGQAILLFDGLDELPNPQFKKTVRDRIRTLLKTYPGNTAIISSRIVGYDEPFRFDDEEFTHFTVGKLRLPEMHQFVADWYSVRVENERMRQEYVRDLNGILESAAHGAIRDLAQNPLLLTIIALVHRIDAVLPDQRVVLYQKCTETLLNTWHIWKQRGTEVIDWKGWSLALLQSSHSA